MWRAFRGRAEVGRSAARGRAKVRTLGLCVVLAARVLVSRAEASAWNEPPGSGLVIADYTYSGGAHYFNGNGVLSPAAAYLKHEGFAYVEYGITDRLMVVVKPDVTAVSIAGTGGPGGPQGAAQHYVGLGTSEAAAQWQALTYGPAVLAVQGGFRLPETVSQANPAQVGNTSRDIDLRALGGLAFGAGPWPAFLDAQGAYRLRSGGAPAEWHANLTIGIRPLPRLLLLLQSDTTVPVGPGTPWFPASLYSKLGCSLVYDISARWSVQIGAFSTIAGTNALRERGIQSAIWYRF